MRTFYYVSLKNSIVSAKDRNLEKKKKKRKEKKAMET
jgi:hypothetical protein